MNVAAGEIPDPTVQNQARIGEDRVPDLDAIELLKGLDLDRCVQDSSHRWRPRGLNSRTQGRLEPRVLEPGNRQGAHGQRLLADLGPTGLHRDGNRTIVAELKTRLAGKRHQIDCLRALRPAHRDRPATVGPTVWLRKRWRGWNLKPAAVVGREDDAILLKTAAPGLIV